MSTRGEINKVTPRFYEMIREVARRGWAEQGGIPVGTGKTLCYVCDIHDGDCEDEELRWTVDVMDVNYDTTPQEGAEGYHPGVMLCASNTNANGFILVPELNSEVIIEKSPDSGLEYVSFVSRVSKVVMDSTTSVKVSCTEHEDYVYTDDGLEKDYFELDETGNKTSLELDKDKVRFDVITKSKSTYVEQTKDKFFFGGEDVQFNGSTYHAVLFEKLKQLLTKFIQYVSTATAAGSPLSTAANISALVNELDSFKCEIVKYQK